MSSTFTWLDYSEQQRRQMLDVIDLFREQETRDELGVGAVRDAFADMLFPGTSTVQTRARYFLFVPWIYRKLEAKHVPSDQISSKARNLEVSLIYTLLDSDDTSGLLGKQAKEKLQRLPSNVYWQGLRVLGMCLYQGSQEKYHRALDGYYRFVKRAEKDSDGESSVPPNWHPGLPEAPEDFPSGVSLRLERTESRYLRDRIVARAPRTLFAFLVDNDNGPAEVDFPWEHPLLSEFPSAIMEQLHHAQNFSEAIHGAAFLYNLMLAEKRESKKLVRDYRDRLNEWSELVDSRAEVFKSWDRKRFWQLILGSGARITPQTRLFIDSWLDIASSGKSGPLIASNTKARNLIRDRERALKRGLARLDNDRALELWNGAAGTGALDYRWGQALVILKDIRDGLGAE